MKTALYRHFDQEGTLLYVGISLKAATRLETHMRDAAWSGEIARITVEYHPNRDLALVAERDAIMAEGPQWNQVHNARVLRARLETTALEPELGSLVASGLIAKIGPTAFAVYCALRIHVDKNKSSVNITMPSIMERTGISRAQIKRSIRALAKAGVIDVERIGRRNRYHLLRLTA
jgi:hypothetical protein